MNKREIILNCNTIGSNDRIQMEVSIIEFEFLQKIADLDIDHNGEKTWIINNQRYKFNGYV